MEEEGIYYYFEHTDGTHTLVLADSYSGHEAYPQLRHDRVSSRRSDNETRDEGPHPRLAAGRATIQPGKYVVTDYDFTKPRAMLQTQYVQKRDPAALRLRDVRLPGRVRA